LARLFRAHERAHELAVNEGRDRVHFDALAGEELARVDAVTMMTGRVRVFSRALSLRQISRPG